MNIQIFIQTWRTRSKSLISWGAVIALMGGIELGVYPTIKKAGNSITQFLDAYPEVMRKMFRLEDFTTGPGFLNAELFSLIIPMVMIGVGLAWGASATADDEEKGTADLLFTLPISRLNILWSRVVAMASALALLSCFIFLFFFLGNRFVHLNLNTSNLLGATISCYFIGLLFASIGTMFGSLTGKRGISLGIGSGIAVLCYLFYTISSIDKHFDFIKPFNPFQWLLASSQLTDGLKLTVNIKFLFLISIFIAISSAAINKRDIHSS